SRSKAARKSPRNLRRNSRTASRRGLTWPRPSRCMSRTATSSSRPDPPHHLSVFHLTQRKHSMTHAIRFHKTGGPEVLSWEEVQVGKPGPGEARIRHTAVGLNFVDIYNRSGLYQ